MALPAASIEQGSVSAGAEEFRRPPYVPTISVAETARELIVATTAVCAIFLGRTFAVLVAPQNIHVHYWLTVSAAFLGLVALFYGARATFIGAWLGIRDLVWTPELCQCLGLLAIAALSVYGLFFDFLALAEQPLWATLVFLVFLSALGQFVSALRQRRIASMVGVDLRALVGDATVLAPEETRKPADTLVRGQRIVIRAGQYVPADAAIVRGKSEVLERRYGGVLRRRFKSKGQEVFAGSFVKSGELECIVVNSFYDATFLPFGNALNGVLATDLQSTGRKAIISTGAAALTFAAACAVLFWRERGATVFELFEVAAAVLFATASLRLLRNSMTASLLETTRLFFEGALVRGRDALQKLGKVRNLVLDCAAVDAFHHMRVVRFDLLDSRTEPRALASAILALCGDAEDPISDAVFDAVSQKTEDPILHEVADCRMYPGRGILGTLEGVELSLGGEAFMIERGVQLQPSDVPAPGPGEQVLFFAVRDEVVARFVVALQASDDEGRKALRHVELSGVRPILCGIEEAAKVDSLAKEVGIELASSHGGLHKKVAVEKFESWHPAAYYSGATIDPDFSSKAAVVMSDFSELRWNVADEDVVMYRPSLNLISRIIARARRVLAIERLTLAAALAAALIVIPLCFLGLMPPAIPLLLSILIW